MDNSALLALIGAGFALAGSPGPNTMSLAAAGAAYGARRSVGYMAGLALGMLVVTIAVAAGVVGRLLADAARKIAVAMAMIVLVNIAWLLVGAGLARYLRSPRASRALNLTFAALLLVSAVALLPF